MYRALLSREHLAVVEEARAFVKSVPADLLRAMDQDQVRYPRDYIESIGAAGLLGLRFAPEWGGRGLPWTVEGAVIEELGTLGTSLACLSVLPSICGEALHLFGTDEQKARYLKPMLSGEKGCAEALTEPRGGSDFFGARTRAVRDGHHYILNGQKRFVVGAEGADCFLVYAVTDPGAPAETRLSLLMVDRDDTVEVQHVYGLLGTRGGGTGRLYFRDTRVPVANVIGGEGAGAMIFNFMMVPERFTSAAGSVGAGRAALEVATRYTTRRTAFGKPIRKYQGVTFQIADALTKVDASRALVQCTARMLDAGMDARRVVSEAKKFATQSAWEAINAAMQVMGGIGYTDVYPIEKMLRDARLPLIWTGTNEIMNLLIQHEWYRELAEGFAGRDVEGDANPQGATEKCYTDEDQLRA
jgi:alkylation response protein AidB-like acyl-CoA dehydrogenase